MKHIKKILLVIAIAIIVTTGVTMALLSNVMDTKVNAFSSDRSLSVMLREPTWDGYQFTDENHSDKPGQVVNPNNSGSSTLGMKDAENYYPSQVIAKNPMLKNTSDKEDEIVAIKVEYVLIEDGKETKLTKAQFNANYATSISSNDTDQNGIHDAFVNVSENELFDIYMYGNSSAPKILGNAEVTEQLFDSIKVNDNVKAKDGIMPNFQIRVTGIAIQSNVDVTTAKAELNALA